MADRYSGFLFLNDLILLDYLFNLTFVSLLYSALFSLSGHIALLIKFTRKLLVAMFKV